MTGESHLALDRQRDTATAAATLPPTPAPPNPATLRNPTHPMAGTATTKQVATAVSCTNQHQQLGVDLIKLEEAEGTEAATPLLVVTNTP